MRHCLRLGRTAALLLLVWIGAAGCARNGQVLPPAAGRIETQPPAHVELNRAYFRGCLTDARDIALSPMRWKGRQWGEAALTAGVAAALFAVDGDVKREVQDNRTSWGNETASAARKFGEGQYTLPALGAFYLYGHFRNNGKAVETALLGLESFAVSGIFTTVLKSLAHRDRPNTGNPPDSWRGPGFSLSNLSFPSGHSTSAFSVATVFATEYGGNRFIPPATYGIAALTALSRVNDNAHWASDVFVGSAIGYFTAKAVCGLRHDGKTAVIPLLDGDSAGLMVAFPY